MKSTPQPTHRIALETPAGRTVAALYPAEAFPGRSGAREGLFRIKIDRVWYRAGGMKYTFLSLEQAFAVLSGSEAPRETERPNLPVGSLVRASGQGRGLTLTRTRTLPIQGPDGRWRVFVALFDEPFLVDDLQQEKMLHVRKAPENDLDPCDDPDGSVSGRVRLRRAGATAP